MMGPEAMGIATVNLVWSDEKVCRNFLCGTCPHTLFTNTVRFLPAGHPNAPPDNLHYAILYRRKWTSGRAQSRIPNA
jgi:hypothetical protein